MSASAHVVINSRDMYPAVVHPTFRPDCSLCTHSGEEDTHDQGDTYDGPINWDGMRAPTPGWYAVHWHPTTHPTTVAESAPAAVPHEPGVEGRTS